MSANLERSFLRGRDQADAVAEDRREALDLLRRHGLSTAMVATASSGSFMDFMTMREAELRHGQHPSTRHARLNRKRA